MPTRWTNGGSGPSTNELGQVYGKSVASPRGMWQCRTGGGDPSPAATTCHSQGLTRGLMRVLRLLPGEQICLCVGEANGYVCSGGVP